MVIVKLTKSSEQTKQPSKADFVVLVSPFVEKPYGKNQLSTSMLFVNIITEKHTTNYKSQTNKYIWQSLQQKRYYYIYWIYFRCQVNSTNSLSKKLNCTSIFGSCVDFTLTTHEKVWPFFVVVLSKRMGPNSDPFLNTLFLV